MPLDGLLSLCANLTASRQGKSGVKAPHSETVSSKSFINPGYFELGR